MGMNALTDKKVGLVTYKKFQSDYGRTSYASKECPGLTVSDNEVRKFLEKHNILCQPLAWDDPYSQFSNFDLLILRSSWNYYHSENEYKEFLKFIDRIPLLYNDPKVIKWNSNKLYLKDLNKKRIPIIPTLFLNDVKALKVKDFNFLPGEKNVVIKPCVSGNARNTHRVDINPIDFNTLEKFKNNIVEAPLGGIMIQPFVESIVDLGEISLIFFRDKFSHAVRRIPLPESFCTHENAISLKKVPLEALDLAKRTLAATYQILRMPAASLLYARVDVLYDPTKGYLLSELEVIEPELFLQLYQPSIDCFGREILQTLYTLA